MAAYTDTEFVAITWYTSGTPSIPMGTSRYSWYNPGGTPDAQFDGWERSLGGLPSGSMFSYYNPIVSSHLGSVSPLSITAGFSKQVNGSQMTIDINVHIDVDSFVVTTSNIVHFVAVELDGYNKPNLARANATDETFTLTNPGESVDISRTIVTSNYTNADDVRVVVFVQSHATNKQVLQAAYASEGWIGDTIGLDYTCLPNVGTLPFQSNMLISLDNLTPFPRTIAASITAAIANGTTFTNWKAGFTNLAADASYNTNWMQTLPGLGSLVGLNTFTLYGYDVTPSPYNQPPYAPSGDSASDACLITAYSP